MTQLLRGPFPPLPTHVRMQLAMLSSDPTAPEPALAARRPPVVTTAESAPCTCPEFCERDHDLD